MKKKINVSVNSVQRIATLRDQEYSGYSCRCVQSCFNIECCDCMFDIDKVYKPEEISQRLIKEEVK